LSVPVVAKANGLVAPIYQHAYAQYVIEKSSPIIKPILDRVEPYHDNIDKVGNQLLDVAEKAAVGGAQLVRGTEMAVLKTLDDAVLTVDRTVDWVLPCTIASSQTEQDDDEATDALPMEPAPLRHAVALTEKTLARLYSILTASSQKAFYDTEDLLKLHATFQLLQQYHMHVEQSTQRLREAIANAQQFVTENMSDREKLKQRSEDVKDFVLQKRAQSIEALLAVQTRLIEATAELKTTVSHALSALSTRAPQFPASVQKNLNSLLQTFSAQWDEAINSGSVPFVSLAQTGQLTMEGLKENLAVMLQRSSMLNKVATDGLVILEKFKTAISAYYTSLGGRVEQLKSWATQNMVVGAKPAVAR
jgi:hypothetical protein